MLTFFNLQVRKPRSPADSRPPDTVTQDLTKISPSIAVPGVWERDLVVGNSGKSAVATHVKKHSRFLILLGVPEGKKADGFADSSWTGSIISRR